MQKKIEDYLHLYLGCEVMVPDEPHPCIMETVTPKSAYIESGCDYPKEEVKPILRPWTDLRPEEVGRMEWDNQDIYWAKKTKKGKITIKYTDGPPSCFRPEEYLFLCALGIDLFGLIPAGLAIDSTTLNPK